MSNKLLKDRMKWFNPENEEMAEWLRSYAKRHDWIGNYSRKEEDNNNIIKYESNVEFARNFLGSWTNKYSINDDDKYKVNLLKSAWRSHTKREQTSTFLLTKNAQKALSYLSKRLDMPKAKIVNALLVEAIHKIKKNKNKKFEAYLQTPNFEKETTSVEKLFTALTNIDEMRIELDILKEECARLQKENEELISQKKHSNI
ncbi:hypothetical protein AL536_04155 [Vibrio fluvialis]|uniref:Uncharacterized protein n=2 Tax=Vibrio fluvialis TaxID=676 RepID=A0AAX2LW05_VIBFL|nr:hypothetical protein [Vibrio fluvialis]AMF92676.1 hypothetical protein AL536_04155 [Vibrio fluvialis]EKO4011856.1 hypothetical protein [Vibrio fluvialis]MBY8229349.1 hypothetical protein [Vibrio fluvialis]MCE7632645.1 hypothetical protein [Vibrio fluvialis]SUQ27549.1 Uncharacterised protein [Vibrio fluvialis]